MGDLRILNSILRKWSKPLEGFNQRKDIIRSLLLIFLNSNGMRKNGSAKIDRIGDSFREK